MKRVIDSGEVSCKFQSQPSLTASQAIIWRSAPSRFASFAAGLVYLPLRAFYCQQTGKVIPTLIEKLK